MNTTAALTNAYLRPKGRWTAEASIFVKTPAGASRIWTALFISASLHLVMALPICAEQLTLPVVAVLPFVNAAEEAIEQSDIDAMRSITELILKSPSIFLSPVFKQFVFNIVPRADMERFFSENNYVSTDVYRPDVMEKLSDAGIDFIITGDVDTHPTIYKLRLYFLDVKKGIFFTSSITRVEKKVLQIRAGLRKMLKQLILGKEYRDYFLDYIDRAIQAGKTENTNTAPLPATYKIGDRGPAGGFIFFVKPKESQGWRYLEAAPEDIKVLAPWGFLIDGMWIPNAPKTSAAVGDGMKNTVLLAEGIIQQRRFTAAEACAQLSYNGYTDWYLPSKGELELLYRNLARFEQGNFSRVSYWSSTQSSKSTAWYQRFTDGRQYHDGNKTTLLSVRPIRTFK